MLCYSLPVGLYHIGRFFELIPINRTMNSAGGHLALLAIFSAIILPRLIWISMSHIEVDDEELRIVSFGKVKHSINLNEISSLSKHWIQPFYRIEKLDGTYVSVPSMSIWEFGRLRQVLIKIVTARTAIP
jgi:hypothetical protein